MQVFLKKSVKSVKSYCSCISCICLNCFFHADFLYALADPLGTYKVAVAGKSASPNSGWMPNAGGVGAKHVTDVMFSQLKKAYSPMLVTPDGILIELRLPQPQKAFSPMAVTLLDIVTEVIRMQLLKAPPAIV